MNIIKYICVFIVGVIITAFIILLLLSFFNILIPLNSDSAVILSANVGILQCLIAVLGIGVALAAYFNFKYIQDKLKEIDKRLGEHDEKFKNDFINNNSSDKEELRVCGHDADNQKKGGLINDL